jgi:hypothetical protein
MDAIVSYTRAIKFFEGALSLVGNHCAIKTASKNTSALLSMVCKIRRQTPPRHAFRASNNYKLQADAKWADLPLATIGIETELLVIL